jgi:hypothetical protein
MVMAYEENLIITRKIKTLVPSKYCSINGNISCKIRAFFEYFHHNEQILASRNFSVQLFAKIGLLPKLFIADGP